MVPLPCISSRLTMARGARCHRTGDNTLVVLLAASALGLVLTPVGGQQTSSTADAAAADDGGSGGSGSGKNASIAAEVQQWMPVCLACFLAVAVFAWCGVNVYRASKAQEAQEADPKGNGDDSAAKGVGRRPATKVDGISNPLHQQSRLPSNRVTGDGNGDSSRDAPLASSTLRPLRSNGGTQPGPRYGAGRALLFPDVVFEGDELQGKKAPGEDGNVYLNPMQRSRSASTSPDTDASLSAGSMSSRPSEGKAAPSSRATSKSKPKSRSSAMSTGDDKDKAGAVDLEQGEGASRGEGGGGGGGGRSGSAISGSGRSSGDQREHKGTSSRQRKQQQAGRGQGGRRRPSGSGMGVGRRGSNTSATGESFSSAGEESDTRNLHPAVLRAARPVHRVQSHHNRPQGTGV